LNKHDFFHFWSSGPGKKRPAKKAGLLRATKVMRTNQIIADNIGCRKNAKTNANISDFECQKSEKS
jgi:hypothetical protein